MSTEQECKIRVAEQNKTFLCEDKTNTKLKVQKQD